MFVLLLGQEQHQCQDPGATVLPRAWDFSQELRTYSEFKTTQAPRSWWTSPKALLSAWWGFFLLLPSPSLLCSHYQLTTFFFFLAAVQSPKRGNLIGPADQWSLSLSRDFAEPIIWLCLSRVSTTHQSAEVRRRVSKGIRIIIQREGSWIEAMSVANSLRICPSGPWDLSSCIVLTSHFLNNIACFSSEFLLILKLSTMVCAPILLRHPAMEPLVSSTSFNI